MSIPILHRFYQKEQILEKMEPASLKARITAQLIDGIILGVVVSALLAIYSRGDLYSIWISPLVPIYIVQTVPGYIPHFADWWWGGYFVTISLPLIAEFKLAYPSPIQWLLYAAYYSIFHSQWGQTPGKMMKGLVILTASQRKLSLAQSFKHWLGYIVSLLPLGLGFLINYQKKNNRTWANQISDSAVYSFLKY